MKGKPITAKSKRIAPIRVSDHEWKTIVGKAITSGLTISEYIRRAALTASPKLMRRI